MVLEAPLFQDVQRRVAHIIENKIIIGHSIWTFLSVRSKLYAGARDHWTLVSGFGAGSPGD